MPRSALSFCLSLLAVVASSRPGPAQPIQPMQAVFDSLRNNVAAIVPAAEKERWDANVSLWKLLLDRGGVVAEIDSVAARRQLEVMRANLGGITLPEEKDRWQSNLGLWQIRLARPGILPRSDRDKVTALLYRMNVNLGRITRADELARWKANYELWKLLFAAP